jgi:hypothetical protein
MNREDFKDIIDEIIYESLIGKNPFKVGDLVKLRPYTFQRHGSNRKWSQTLQKLDGKVGKVIKVFPDSKHVNVKYTEKWTTEDEHGRSYTVDTIGIDYTNLIPAENPEKELGEVTKKNLKQTLPKLNPDDDTKIGDPKFDRSYWDKFDRNKREFNLDRLTMDELNALVIKFTRFGDKEKASLYSNEIAKRLKFINAPVDEGVGWGDPKKIAKDRLHTKNKLTGKVQRWTTKFKGRHEKDESVNINEIKKITNEILNEMWVGWEENKDQDSEVPTTLYKQYKDLVDRLGGEGETAKIAKEKLDQILSTVLKKKVNEENITHKDDIKSFTPGTPNPKSYIIYAKSGPSTVYYVNSPTQGERMVQNAQSMAYRFQTEEEVRNKIIRLKQKYKGILNWDFQIVGPKTWESVWHSVGPKVINLGHQVTKPTKNRDTGEWVVKWFTDGKKDESKTYYTDDQKDANDTYLRMLKNADELNKQG